MDVPRKIKAKYSGTCEKCHRASISVGDAIYQHGNGWALQDCEFCKKQDAALALLKELQPFMLTQHQVSFGIHAAGGVHMASTRREYLEICEKKQAITPEEKQLLTWYWSGLMSYSLFD